MAINNKKIGRIVGILFIIGTLAGILSAVLTNNILQSPNYIVEISANKHMIALGALLVLTMGFSLAMIPVLLYPFFKKQSEVLALGAIVFRGVLEAVMYISIATTWLLLLSISQEYIAGQNLASLQAIGMALQKTSMWSVQILAVVFSVGALMIYYLFFISKLIPRWLSLWGLVGAVLYLVTPLSFILFNQKLEVLMMPLALQEMVLAVWLIVKGLNSPTNVGN